MRAERTISRQARLICSVLKDRGGAEERWRGGAVMGRRGGEGSGGQLGCGEERNEVPLTVAIPMSRACLPSAAGKSCVRWRCGCFRGSRNVGFNRDMYGLRPPAILQASLIPLAPEIPPLPSALFTSPPSPPSIRPPPSPSHHRAPRPSRPCPQTLSPTPPLAHPAWKCTGPCAHAPPDAH